VGVGVGGGGGGGGGGVMVGERSGGRLAVIIRRAAPYSLSWSMPLPAPCMAAPALRAAPRKKPFFTTNVDIDHIIQIYILKY